MCRVDPHLEILAAELRIAGHRHRTHPEAGEHRQDPLDSAADEGHERVTSLDPACRHRPREPRAARDQLPEVPLATIAPGVDGDDPEAGRRRGLHHVLDEVHAPSLTRLPLSADAEQPRAPPRLSSASAPSMAPQLALAAQLRAVVELLDDHPARGGRLDTEVAEDALVEVLGDDHDVPLLVRVDVDRADLLELRGDLGVVADLLGDLDVDEDTMHLPGVGHQTPPLPFALAGSRAAPSRELTASGISSIRSTTGIPADSRRALFSVAESSAPSTIVPAWPKLIPFISSSSMNLPAMKATIGSAESFSSRQSTSSASIRPPGSV